jgi:hypothetical protein
MRGRDRMSARGASSSMRDESFSFRCRSQSGYLRGGNQIHAEPLHEGPAEFEPCNSA